MSDQTALTLLRDTESYLSALHGSVARHDNLAANLACAGCELRSRINAVLRHPATVAYRRRDGRELRCLAHAPAANLIGLDWFPLTDAEVEGDASAFPQPGCTTDVLAEDQEEGQLP